MLKKTNVAQRTKGKKQKNRKKSVSSKAGWIEETFENEEQREEAYRDFIKRKDEEETLSIKNHLDKFLQSNDPEDLEKLFEEHDLTPFDFIEIRVLVQGWRRTITSYEEYKRKEAEPLSLFASLEYKRAKDNVNQCKKYINAISRGLKPKGRKGRPAHYIPSPPNLRNEHDALCEKLNTFVDANFHELIKQKTWKGKKYYIISITEDGHPLIKIIEGFVASAKLKIATSSIFELSQLPRKSVNTTPKIIKHLLGKKYGTTFEVIRTTITKA